MSSSGTLCTPSHESPLPCLSLTPAKALPGQGGSWYLCPCYIANPKEGLREDDSTVMFDNSKSDWGWPQIWHAVRDHTEGTSSQKDWCCSALRSVLKAEPFASLGQQSQAFLKNAFANLQIKPLFVCAGITFGLGAAALYW